jgi:hypothetical protein
MSHKSHFTFRTRGGECAGEQWIYDHEEPIARLESRRIEQPEQNLRYFDRNLKPINLRDLKLKPGGRPLISGFQLFWNIPTPQLLGIELEAEGEILIAVFITADPYGMAHSRRRLTLSYDPELASYLYDFQDHLQLLSPEAFDQNDEVRFEYSDPWYNDVPAPILELPGLWPKRYSHLLAEAADGSVWQMPLNHLATGIPAPQAFKPDGLFILGYDQGNNPAFEFVGETAARTAVAVCNWGYDIHINMRYSRDELYAPLCPHMRIRLCPDEQVRQLMARAAPVPDVQLNGHSELPLYERRTSFEKGMKLNEPSPGTTDPWVWEPQGQGLEWCKDSGRSDSYSLKISKDTPVPASWSITREGDGAWSQKWTLTQGYRISAYIKTEEVQGRGAFLAVRWAVYNQPEYYPLICSQKLVGSHDWTRVEVEIQGPPPDYISSIAIILRQDGAGTTWFDDLEVIEVKNTSAYPSGRPPSS